MELSGSLVLNTGPRVVTLDLKTLEQSVMPKHLPGRLAKIDDNRILFESGDGEIQEQNLKKNTTTILRRGYYPQYIPEHRKVFFLSQRIHEVEIGNPVLFVADYDHPETAEEIMMPPRKKYGFSQDQVVQISHDEVVFRYDQRTWVYNILSRSVKKSPAESCPVPIAFRDATGTLLCSDGTKGDLGGTKFLLDLSDGSTEEVPGLTTHYPVLYLPKFDALITSKKRLKIFPINQFGETADLWVYSFKDGSETLLKKDIWTQPDSTVWIE